MGISSAQFLVVGTCVRAVPDLLNQKIKGGNLLAPSGLLTVGLAIIPTFSRATNLAFLAHQTNSPFRKLIWQLNTHTHTHTEKEKPFAYFYIASFSTFGRLSNIYGVLFGCSKIYDEASYVARRRKSRE